MEVWKDIQGFEGIYQVSSLGRVRSLDRVIHKLNVEQRMRGRILSPTNNGTGYMKVNLSKDGKAKLCFVHRLVVEAFIPNSCKLSQINHIDENKSNNQVNNLEWCSSEYNINYGERTNKVRLTANRPVIQCDKKGTIIKEFASATIAEAETGIPHQNISKCCYGHKNYSHAGGFIWKFK